MDRIQNERCPIAIKSDLTVYALSDASGETAENVARAAAMQFCGCPIRLVRLPRVVGPQQLHNLFKVISQADPAVLVFTMVDPDLRRQVHLEASALAIRAIDVLGAPIAAISLALNVEPRLEAGLLHKEGELYFKRMEAIEFAIQYDDCKDPRGLLLAEVILIGVSRCSKTPICMYLAQNRGLRTANVPILKDVPPPPELFEVPPGRIVGLSIQPTVLHRIRIARLHALGLTESANYVNLENIKLENEYAKNIFRRLRCPVVDVTNKAIEETASEILEITNRKETFV
ncbi:MAG TPA: phosphoenolpyruvate synthase regulatory protein [Cyanobacteria bacterium UBA8530]|nr:phosphoenolpyruvate synthase regulatory protein [Cyanobacteria bacterium UBA8530]